MSTAASRSRPTSTSSPWPSSGSRRSGCRWRGSTASPDANKHPPRPCRRVEPMSAIINGGKPVELLLVEDNSEEAELTMETLREGRIPNLRVHWVEDGEQAMAFLRREGRHASAPRPDLVLLDLNMPRMSGLEVLAEIKQHPDWKRLPVVMMTSSSHEKDILGAYSRHVNC